MSSCTFNFHTNVLRSNLSCFTDCTTDASVAALIHRQQTLNWLFTQTKLSSIYRNKPIVTYMYWALMKRKSIKDFGNFGRHFPCATCTKILAACTRVCHWQWHNLF